MIDKAVLGCSVEEVCPVPILANMQKKLVDWNIEDPKDKAIEKVGKIADEIDRKVRAMAFDFGKRTSPLPSIRIGPRSLREAFFNLSHIVGRSRFCPTVEEVMRSWSAGQLESFKRSAQTFAGLQL